MAPLAWLLIPLLAVCIAVPVAGIALMTAVLAPAVAEQVRINPCSAYPSNNASLSVPDAQEGGVGFDLPRPGRPRHQSLTSPARPIPARVERLYRAAANRYRVPWELLAAIGMAETRHGANRATSSAGAQGLMQFMPQTFAAYGVDGDGDGRIRIRDDADSIFSAANYLTVSGVTHGKTGVIKALWAYNHSVSYRNDVLYYAHAYSNGRVVVLGDPTDCGDESPDGDPSLPPITSDKVQAMIGWGRRQLGDRYILGANGPNTWDCSSFVQGMFRAAGISIPRTARGQRSWLAKGNGHRISAAQARPGDLVFTDTWLGPNVVGHVMLVYDPATHRSLEARRRGVGIYRYTDFRSHHIYEFWRVGNLTT